MLVELNCMTRSGHIVNRDCERNVLKYFVFRNLCRNDPRINLY